MNDEQILSQDELNVLLGGKSEQDNGEPIDMTAYKEAFRLLYSDVASALSDWLKEEIHIEVGEAKTEQTTLFEIPPNQFVVNFHLSEGLVGEATLALTQETALHIASLIAERKLSKPEQAEEAAHQLADTIASSLQSSFNALLATSVPVTASSIQWTKDRSLPYDQHEVDGDSSLICLQLTTDVNEEQSGAQFVLPTHVAQALLVTMNEVAQQEDKEPGEMVDEKATTESEAVSAASVGEVESAAGSDVLHSREPVHVADGAEQDDAPIEDVQFAPLGEQSPKGDRDNLNLLLDVPLGLTVELGRTEMQMRDILGLSKGQVIELDKLAGEPVDVFVNNKLIAKGEVVVMNENFGVKITHILSREDRVRSVQ